MKTKILAAFIGLSIIVIISCEKEECGTCNKPPVINQQIFDLHENTPNGSVIGTIIASDPDLEQKILFSIIGGNNENVFRIDKNTGVLYVNKSNYLDYEKYPVFELAIEVTDSCEESLSSANTIIINLIDIAPTKDGLVSYYAFERTVEDKEGNNNGIGTNVDYLDDFAEQSNHVLMLNGIDSYVDLQNPFDYEAITINLWFNSQSFENNFDLIYTSDNPTLQFGFTSIAVKNDNDVNNLYISIADQTITKEISKNTWYNVTVIKDKMEFNCYLDNVLLESGVFEDYLTSFDGIQSAILGSKRTLQSGYFMGFIDELRIYNRALSIDELEVLYNE